MEEWAEGFPALPESCPSSQQLLARLELPPSSAVREIREVDAAAAAGGRPALAARSLPRAALHHFKFKLQPPRGFALVWSSRAPGEADGEGGGKEGKEAFSVWAAELELGAVDALKKGSGRAVRINLGHVAVAGGEPPGKTIRVLEVSDTSERGPLGASNPNPNPIPNRQPNPNPYPNPT